MKSQHMQKWQSRYEKARKLAAADIFGILCAKTAERFDRSVFRIKSLLPGYPSNSGLRKALRLVQPFHVFVERSFPAFSNFFLNEEEKNRVALIIQSRFGKWAEDVTAEAEEILRHRFTLLGTKVDAGWHIDWQRDYTCNYAWPCLFSTRVPKVISDNESDIKYPWELSRFHQGVLLGRAFALTKDEKYAREFFSQFRDWMIENPPGYGVNWKCTMEVAIRAVNIIWSFFFLGISSLCDSEARILLLKCMLAHGRFIFKNLEFNRVFVEGRFQPVNGNHYVADLAGLLYISLMFPEFRESPGWLKKAYEGLVDEIGRQVDGDGVHRELSPNYHRLVLEMFLSSLLLLAKNGITVPAVAWKNVEKMFDYICYYTKPDRSAPLVRDIDNGRFQILGREDLTSHTHLLPVAAMLFSKPGLADSGPSEDALWLLGPKAVGKIDILAGVARNGVPASRAFPESGVYLLRQDRLYMLALCSPVGLKGTNGHAHNDFLSFELFAHDKSFLADCGSFAYTRQPAWRNRFRSTWSHNTAVIDGRETNPFREEELFTLRSSVSVHVDRWETGEEVDFLEAHYQLNGDKSAGVIHRRRFVFIKGNDREEGYWLIQDRFEGNAEERHRIEIRFHFSSGIRVAVEDRLCVRTVCEKGANLVLFPLTRPTMLALNIQTGWMSAVYAQKQQIEVARYTYAGELPVSMTYVLYPVAHTEEQADGLPRILSYRDFLAVQGKRAAILEKVEELGLL